MHVVLDEFSYSIVISESLSISCLYIGYLAMPQDTETCNRKPLKVPAKLDIYKTQCPCK